MFRDFTQIADMVKNFNDLKLFPNKGILVSITWQNENIIKFIYFTTTF